MADVGLVSVVKTVPLGSRKLKTVELKSKPANAPCRKRLLTSCSTSPCENWDGLVPGNMWEGVNVEVIGSLLKYCIITLFKLVSAIAAAKASSILSMSASAHDDAPPIKKFVNTRFWMVLPP